MDIDAPNNVFDFHSIKAALEDVEPLTAKPRSFQECWHKKRIVSLHERKVFCRDCEVELDPYQVLSEIAHEYSGWKVKQMKERLAELEQLSKKIEAKLKPDLMTDAERDLPALEFRARHKCDPARMWRKGDMIHCYCGSAFNRHAYPLKALEVFAEHQRLARKANFELKVWPNAQESEK